MTVTPPGAERRYGQGKLRARDLYLITGGRSRPTHDRGDTLPLLARSRDGFLIVRVTGSPDFEAFFAELDEILAGLQGEPARGLLIDLSQDEGMKKLTPDDLRMSTARFLERGEHFSWRMATVASNDLHYGLAKMTEAFADGSRLETRIFRTAEDSWTWLTEVDPDS